MTRKLAAAAHKKGVRRLLALLLAGGALVCMLAFWEEDTSPVLLCSGEGDILLLEEAGDTCFFVKTTDAHGELYALDASSGAVLAQAETSHPLEGAALRGGLLYLLEQRAEELVLSCWDTQLHTEDSWALPVAPDSFSLFDWDGTGVFYYTSPQDPAALWAVDPYGELPRPVETPSAGDITFLEATPGGNLFVGTAGTLHWAAAPPLDAWNTGTTMFPPVALVGETGYVNQLGQLYLWEDGGFQPAGKAPTNPLLTAVDREGQLLTASGTTVQASSLSGEPVGSVEIPGEVAALCGSGALFRQEGNFLFFPARFYQEPDPTATPSPAPSPSEEPQPSSSPTPSLTPTPEPSPTPADPTISPSPSDNPDGIAIDGEWLVMPAGTTVETVVAWFVPGTVSIRDHAGQVVDSGSLATGMTAGAYQVAVQGDCDGSGSLSRNDLQEAQALLLEGTQVDSPYRRAADWDDDGLLTTQDLVLLAQQLS